MLLGRTLFAFVAVGALTLGCSGKSESGDDDDGSASGTGGTSGFGGTSGASGATSTGGTSPTGGTGSTPATCVSLCGRAQTCPDAGPVDCELECRNEAAEASAAGCTYELDRFYACVSTADLCGDLSAACGAELYALVRCYNGDPSGRCMEGAAAPSTTCAVLCQRFEACPNSVADCATSCAASGADAATMGCAAEYQRYLDCAGTCQNLCGLSADDCPSSSDAYANCASNFCTANPSSPECAIE